ncbi:MAG: DUF4166 domain-containing protein [Xanthomonadales bacterium]|nr:DUF4166 domain-containing protein [Xanthomonadales bacterium]
MARVMTTLFASLLGDRFAALAPRVRALHAQGATLSWRGEVEVERGRGWLAALCAWATRLPPAGRGSIQVEILVDARCERWTRRIGAHAMRSRLWAAHGLLHERLGLVTFGFALVLDGDALCWRVARAWVLGVPVPARWFAAVHAREHEQDGRYRFEVQAALPLAGPLLRYRGWLAVDG